MPLPLPDLLTLMDRAQALDQVGRPTLEEEPVLATLRTAFAAQGLSVSEAALRQAVGEHPTPGCGAAREAKPFCPGDESLRIRHAGVRQSLQATLAFSLMGAAVFLVALVAHRPGAVHVVAIPAPPMDAPPTLPLDPTAAATLRTLSRLQAQIAVERAKIAAERAHAHLSPRARFGLEASQAFLEGWGAAVDPRKTAAPANDPL
jgi:hypothetical protein